MTPGPVQRAVRAAVAPGAELRTPARGAPFVVEAVDGSRLVLLMGAGRHRTPFDWRCLEGIPDFLRGKGWVEIRTVYGPGQGGTLHDYLLGCINRATANWIAVVLETAGVVEIDRGRPLRVRLKPGY